jgi:hypothetical protein
MTKHAGEMGEMILQYEQWENSLEGVHYQLNLMLRNPDLEGCIVRTVLRLPAEVRAFVYGECKILDAGNAVAGHVMPTSWVEGSSWLIILDGNLTVTLEDEDAQSIVAHEISHAWLKHSIFAVDLSCEKEAAEQTAAWGFSGKGADIKYCMEGPSD